MGSWMKITTDILNKELLDRDIFPQVTNWIEQKEAVILIGSRQVGKTCLLYLLIQHLVDKMNVPTEDIFYFDLEYLDALEMLNAGVQALLDFSKEQSPGETKKYIFIDEIQYLDNPSNLLKLLVDHYADKVKIFASGSSALTIKKKFKDSLVGRKITFEIYSLNFNEYLLFKKELTLKSILERSDYLDPKPISTLSHNKLLNYYDEYSRFGGYPAVVLLDEYAAKRKYLNDIYISYVRIDVSALFTLENITAFNNMVKMLALNIGNLINIQEVSKSIGLARQTVIKYFNILESTYICRFIQPYFSNKQKEIVKMQKVYFYDTGLRNRVINDFRPIRDRVDAGALIENTVFKNLLRRVETRENIKFWRMKYGLEVDFILDEEQVLPIEVKLKETDTVTPGISSFLNSYNVPEAIIANRKTIQETGKVKFVPFYTI